MKTLGALLSKWRRRSRGARAVDLVDYWRERARAHGARSVLNLAHSAAELAAVTERQSGILFPLLARELDGTESLALDFGCGPGRFTGRLADVLGGGAIGADVVPELLALAPRLETASWVQIGPSALPFASASFDVAWSCLVLGGIPAGEIERSVAELCRVLRPGGLLFVAENTTEAPDRPHWFFRSEAAYLELLSAARPRVLAGYDDAGERISVFAGRMA